MPKNLSLLFLIFGSALGLSCQSAQEIKVESANTSVNAPKTTASVMPKELVKTADIPKLINQSAAELDQVFGQPEKITPAEIAKEIPGEYRLYKIAGHPKGLSVRFYKGKAVRFNLLLGTPEKSSHEALLKYFGIDVSKMTSVKGDPLSETWKGSSNGVNFATAYAKREKAGGEFVMVHAELAQ